jgi:hypothetical protein
MWSIAPVLALLTSLGIIAARSRRRKEAKADSIATTSPPEAGKGEP